MSKTMIELRKEAVRLRTECGLSYSEISNSLSGVPKSTLSHWLTNYPLTEEQRVRVYGKRSDSRLGGAGNARRWSNARSEMLSIAKDKFRDVTLDRNAFSLAGAALYWGEGRKGKNYLSVSNSDPELLLFFVTWLREIIGVDPRDLRCSISVHLGNGITILEIKEYWASKLGIPINQFRNLIINPTSPGWRHTKKSVHKYGIPCVFLASTFKYRSSVVALLEKIGKHLDA